MCFNNYYSIHLNSTHELLELDGLMDLKELLMFPKPQDGEDAYIYIYIYREILNHIESIIYTRITYRGPYKVYVVLYSFDAAGFIKFGSYRSSESLRCLVLGPTTMYNV